MFFCIPEAHILPDNNIGLKRLLPVVLFKNMQAKSTKT